VVGVFTERTRQHITTLHSWDRAKVFTYTCCLGFALITLQVLVLKLIVMFLSWLIQAMGDVNIAIVTGIIADVGILIFLVPVIPGMMSVCGGGTHCRLVAVPLLFSRSCSMMLLSAQYAV
jgi:hypothetical protein